MLYPMRRFIIVISILFTIIVLTGGVLYYVIQQQLRALPVEDLSYNITGLGYKHIRLEHLNFIYIEDGTDEPVRAPVEINDAFITWQWSGFRPRLQIIEVDQITASLNTFPQPDDEEPPLTLAQRLESIALPDDWRLPTTIPHRVHINQFTLELPCANGPCHYSGELRFDSENNNPVLTADQPQRTELDLLISPYNDFRYREQINIHIEYEVTTNLPTLLVIVQAPDALNLEWRQTIDRANRLNGHLSGTIDPVAGWLIDDIWRWLPEAEDLAADYLQLASQRITINSNYQTQLPASTMDRWLNEMSGSSDTQIELHEALSLSLQGTLQRDDTIRLQGDGNVRVHPAFYRNLDTFVNDAVDEYLERLTQPVTLTGDWLIELPPGTMPASWINQAEGRFSYELESEQSFTIPDIGSTTLASQGEVEFSAGHLMLIDTLVHGIADVTGIEAALGATWDELNLEPGQIQWSAHVYHQGLPDVRSVPLHLQVQSTGYTNISADFQFLLDADNMALHSTHGLLNFTLNELSIEPLELSNLRLSAPVTVTFAQEEMAFKLHSSDSVKASAEVSYTDSDDAELTYSTAINAFINDWEWSGRVDQFPSSRFSGNIDIALNNTVVPALNPTSWRWQGNVEGSPLAEEGPILDGQGRLTNNAGLIFHTDFGINLLGFSLDWRMSDIFWLAGNPFATMLEEWPELLSLDRGRTRASGRFSVPRISPTSFQAEIEFNDVAGIFSTAAFSGLRSQINIDASLSDVTMQLTDTQVQRIQYGFTQGPGDIALSYSASLDDLFGGTVDIQSARLAMLNGELSLRPARFDLDNEEYTLHVDISQLDVARLFTEYPVSDLQGSGLLSGQLPIRISSQGVFIERGELAALPPGGQIRYSSEQAKRMAQSNQAMALLFNVLDDFHYSELAGGVSYRDDGWLELALTLEGQNPAMHNGHPVRLEVTLEEDLPALLRSLQLANQLNEVIQERVQQFLLQRMRN